MEEARPVGISSLVCIDEIKTPNPRLAPRISSVIRLLILVSSLFIILWFVSLLYSLRVEFRVIISSINVVFGLGSSYLSPV